MKTKNLLLFLFLFSLICCKNNQETVIELPLTFQQGYGHFRSGMGGVGLHNMYPNNPWDAFNPEVSGIPENWTDVKTGHHLTDMYQYVYQNYIAGTLSQEFYDNLQENWNWTPDESILSKEPVKCYFIFMVGLNPQGEKQMIIDVNNNGDLSDDPAFTVPLVDFASTDLKVRDSLAATAPTVKYERLLGGEIVPDEIPVLFVQPMNMDMMFFNFPVYATTQFNEHRINVSSGFMDIRYDKVSIALIPDGMPAEEKLEEANTIRKNEYLVVDNILYKNLGVDISKNILRLEKINKKQTELESTQIGFKAVPFGGREFSSNDSISLDTFKGKYVYVDFWATWCGPCIGEFPELKALYETVDKSRFEILGVVGSSDKPSLTQRIEDSAITWPQIFSDQTNNITRLYDINGFPTTFLIDPDGIIIAKNLRGQQLKDKVEELLGK